MNKKIIPLVWTLLIGVFSTLHAQDESIPEFDDNCCESEECPTDAFSNIRGKADIGAAYVHIDVLLSGRTEHKMDLGGVRADLYYRIWKGLVIKPSVLYAKGEGRDEILTGGIGLGFCLPYKQRFCFTPIGGINWGDLRTRVTFAVPFQNPVTGNFEEGKIKVKETFRSSSPYVGFEFSYNFCPTWRTVFTYQYSWSRTRTTLKHVGSSKGNSKGSNYGLLLEHDITSKWSINLGAAYNCSLSHEKHGIRAYGGKIGLAYWF